MYARAEHFTGLVLAAGVADLSRSLQDTRKHFRTLGYEIREPPLSFEAADLSVLPATGKSCAAHRSQSASADADTQQYACSPKMKQVLL